MARRRSRTPPPVTERDVTGVVRLFARRWLRAPGITSVGVGYKVVAGQRTPDLCVQFTVARKVTEQELAAVGLPALPRSFPLRDGRQIPVDVLERTYRPAWQSVAMPAPDAPLIPAVRRRRRNLQIVPGISIGREDDAGAGTIGAIVYDRLTRAPLVLSNWHVLAGPDAIEGDAILQPGRWDDGRVEANVLGSLVRSHIGLAGDGAVASIRTRSFDPAILELDVVPARLVRAEIGDRVVKSGRTTGVTFGTVVRSNIIVARMAEAAAPIEIGGFEIAADPDFPPASGLISDEGDSGSLWLIQQDGRATDMAAGLHFAMDSRPGSIEPTALACNLHSILGKLDVTLVP